MVVRTSIRRATFVAAGISLLLAFPLSAGADHSWGDYHWSRSSTTSELELKLGDNVGSIWDDRLTEASVDWSRSSVLNTSVVRGRTDPSRCSPTSGRVEVCSAQYGETGWLGLAQIWASGSHITQARAMLNDTYFSAPGSTSDNYEWRQMVMCHEVGHTLGLAHRDEDFWNSNVGSCLDYTADPDGDGTANPSNLSPDEHDYEQLEAIYSHAHGGGGGRGRPGAGSGAADVDSPREWGRLVESSNGGRTQTFVRRLSDSVRVVTFVTWADAAGQ